MAVDTDTCMKQYHSSEVDNEGSNSMDSIDFFLFLFRFLVEFDEFYIII